MWREFLGLIRLVLKQYLNLLPDDLVEAGMKTFLLFLTLLSGLICFGQSNDKISVIDFVEILDNNREEALYYYQNNWLVLRKNAVEKGYIDSFQLLETSFDENGPFHLMLITTYSNKRQFDKREENFSILLEERGPTKLLNDKKPEAFRKNTFYKSPVTHLTGG